MTKDKIQNPNGQAVPALPPASHFDHDFSVQEAQRGRKYFLEGRVALTALSEHSFEALVSGSKRYEVDLDFKFDRDGECTIDHFCTCPAWQREGSCKHVYAVLVAALLHDALGRRGMSTDLLSKVRRRSPSDLSRLRLLARLSGGGSPAVPVDGPSPTAVVPTPTAAAAHASGTQQRLDDLRRSLITFQRRAQPTRTEALELHFHVLGRTSAAKGRLCVRPVVRGAAAAGGKRKWRVLEARDMEKLDATSRRSLQILGGASYEFETSSSGIASYASWRGALEVPAALLPSLAELWNANGTLFATGTDSPGVDGEQRVVRIAREPWRFEARYDESTDVPEVVGEIVRGDERHVLHAGAYAERDGRTPIVIDESHVLLLDEIAPLDLGRLALLASNLKHQGPMRFPREHGTAALHELAELCGDRLVGAALPPVGIETDPVPLMRIERPQFTSAGVAHHPCSLHFVYGEREVGFADPARVVFHGGHAYQRSPRFEEQACNRVFELGVRPRAEHERDFDFDGYLASNRLPDVAATLLDEGWRVAAAGVEVARPKEMPTRVTSGVDWFGVSSGLDFDGQVVELPQLLAAARSGGRWIDLGDGRRGLLPKDWLERWRWLEFGRRGEGDAIHFARGQGWLLEALLAARGPVDADAGFTKFREGLRAFERVLPCDPTGEFEGELRGYQREGLGWFEYLERMGFGGCLADDMGLGKTVQVLALLEARRAGRKRGTKRLPSLAVVPRSLLFNWADEAARFAPKLHVALHHGPGRRAAFEQAIRADLIVTTYSTLRLDAAAFGDAKFDVVVLDEAQAIKNDASQAAKAVRLLDARMRLALSGTPVENRIEELWSLFEFLNPGMLGSSPAFKRLLGSGGDRTQQLQAVGRAIRPFFLRRTKEQVLAELPPKTEQVMYVELPAKQRKTYDELAQFYRAQLLGAEVEGQDEPKAMQVLTALLRLRQCACHVGLIDKSKRSEPSAKLDELVPMLEELVAEGHKAVVFSQFTQFLDLLKQRLRDAKLSFESLDGRTRDRKAKVDQFQSDPSVQLFLVSLKAGGVGLNLTAADYVFLLDPWWNPAAEAQAIDRAHRIGRTRPVHAYRLVARDTIEERVLELQADKRVLAATLLDGAAGSVADLTRADLERLLG